jgi:hypothetical protein
VKSIIAPLAHAPFRRRSNDAAIRKRQGGIVAATGVCYQDAPSGGARRRNGHVAEWLRSGLQIRIPRFDSGRGLHRKSSSPDRLASFYRL